MKPGRPARVDAIELSAYLRAIRRGSVAVAVCALVGAIAGVGWMVRTPKVYSSTSAVLVSDVPLYLARKGEEGAKWFTIDTEASRLVSEPVLDATRKATGEKNIRAHVHLAAVPTTKVLKVTYNSTDKVAAQRGAATMTETYLQLRRADLEKRRDDRVELIGQQIATLNARLDETVVKGKASAGKIAEQRASRAAIIQQIAARQTESRQVRTTSAYPGGRAAGRWHHQGAPDQPVRATGRRTRPGWTRGSAGGLHPVEPAGPRRRTSPGWCRAGPW